MYYFYNMYDFRYVTKKEAAPFKKEIIKILHKVQKEVKKDFTFQFYPVGSSSRNMITCDRNGNIGFDFDFNIEPNDPEGNYNPYEMRTIIFNAIDRHMRTFGYSKIENSTSVITIKAIDYPNSRIKYSCDFAIVHHYNENGKKMQEYIEFDKYFNRYNWKKRGKDFYIAGKINWLKKNGYWNELRDSYIDMKNKNHDPDKHSRSILAESVNDMYQKYHNDKGDSKAGYYFATVRR